LSHTICPLSCRSRSTRPSRPGDGNNQIAPQRDAAVAVGLLLPRVHLPHHAAHGAGADVDLVDDAPHIRDVEKAVLDQRRRLDIFIARGAAQRNGKASLRFLTFDRLIVSSGENRCDA